MNLIKLVLLLLTVWGSLIYSEESNLFELNAKANRFISENKCKDALEILQLIITKEPEHSIAYNRMAYCYAVLGEYDKSLEFYEKAYQISPNLDSLIGKQWVLLLKGKNSESVEVGKEALNLDGRNYWVLLRQAEAYYKMGEYQKSEELYRKIEELHGETAETIWRKGINKYLNGEMDNGLFLFWKAYEKNPKHAGARYSLGLPTEDSEFTLGLFYNPYSFQGSSLKGRGEKAGLFLSYFFLDSWTIRLGLANERLDNYNSTKGVWNYIFDEYNLIQYSYYTSRTEILSYLSNTYNTYKLYSLLTSPDYSIQHGSLGLSFYQSYRSNFYADVHYIRSNDSYTNGGVNVNVGLSYGKSSRIIGELGSISYPANNGMQASLAYHWAFHPNFYSKTKGIVQKMQVQQTDILLLQPNPIWTYSTTNTLTHNLAAIQETLGFTYKWFHVAIGGRLGKLYTPILEGQPVYNPSYMNGGGYGLIQYNYDHIGISLSGSRDFWKNSIGERNTSNSGSISLQVRF
ncbi:MAG: tetratricopeptide repeat protein [Leptospiraceae bacterium]|nr:tetratricopeptide repeat protein [Leptospiraceae bacterium]